MSSQFVIGFLLATAAWATGALFFRLDTPAIAEAAKLLAQFLGALLIAWIAVKWALVRYKSEKTWEREVSALLDVLTALRAMQDVNYEFAKEYDTEGAYSEEFRTSLHERRREAKAKLFAVSAVAGIVFPSSVRDSLTHIEEIVVRSFEDDEPYIDYLQRESRDLEAAERLLLAASSHHLRK